MESGSNARGPCLERTVAGDVAFLTDPGLLDRTGVVVAFSERTGGMSREPYDSLNLAAHVGDDPASVDENRGRFLDSLGLGHMCNDLVMSEQVHGEHVHIVGDDEAGKGSRAAAGAGPIPQTDALVTSQPRVPLLMCFADCVPVVLVAEEDSRKGVAVVHAGWKGSLAGLPGKAALALAQHVGCDMDRLLAYIGPHIGSCCYNVDAERMSLFSNRFDTIAAVGDRLDLSAAVSESLWGAGVPRQAIAEAGQCTFDHTERFFSFRAAPVTGRHGAIAAIV